MEGELWDRTRTFAIDTVRFVRKLPNDPAGWVLGKQLLRSGTSIGANYREARRARTRVEFLSKVQIALQEAEETRYWLELIAESELVVLELVQPLLNEIREIIAMLVATIKTGKRRQRRRQRQRNQVF
jgi:four helix bundle protein